MSRYIGLCHPKGCNQNTYYVFCTANRGMHIHGLTRAIRILPNLKCDYILLDSKRIFDVSESQTRVAYSKNKYKNYKDMYNAVLKYLSDDNQAPFESKIYWSAVIISNKNIVNLSIDDIVKNAIELKE
jgi:hypothetical protein